MRRDDGGRGSGPYGADEVRFGSVRPEPCWRAGSRLRLRLRSLSGRPPRRLLLGVSAVLAVLVAVVIVRAGGPGTKPSQAAGAGEARLPPLDVPAGWELFGYDAGGVVRIQLAAGRATQTPVPPLDSGGPVTFIVGPHQVIIRPLDFVPGYLVPDGQPASLLTGALSTGSTVIPGPEPGTAWVQSGFQATLLPLVRMDGSATGMRLRLPSGNPGLVIPDGQGYALYIAGNAGTLYDVRPGGVHRIDGALAAVGPTRWLVVTCHSGRRCSNVVVDQASGIRHVLPGPSANPGSAPAVGVIAPDGSTAAVLRVNDSRVTLHLLNLMSGADQQVRVSLDQGSVGGQTLAWSPDSRWLFVVAANGELAAIDVRTSHVRALGTQLPAIGQIGLRT